MICKSNNNSHHDATSAFFYVFFEKDSHLNAVEQFLSSSLDNLVKNLGKDKFKYLSQ